MAQCLTPQKTLKFATEQVARREAARRQQYPYLCSCGFWHLTSRQYAADTVDPELVTALLALPDKEFTVIVRAESVGQAPPAVAAALRAHNKQLLNRWNRELGVLKRDMHAFVGSLKGRFDAEAAAQREAGQRRMMRATARCEEIKTIRDAMAAELARQVAARKAIRRTAGERAVSRLVAAHREEFDQLFNEERDRLTADTPNNVRTT